MAASVKTSHRETVCLLCHGDFIKVPKLLPCFHSFCKECLQPKVDCLNVGDKLPCPHCGMTTTVPSGGIYGIQDDFLQEINLKLSEIHNVKTPFCNVCESIDEKILAFHYCVNCQYYLCDRDKQIHKATPSQKNHCVISYEEMKSGLYDTEIVSSKLGNCPKHSSDATTQRLSFYCEKCEVLACQECFLITHQGHGIKSISEVSGDHEKLINDLLERVKHSKRSKTEAIEKTETELDSLKNNSNRQVVEIQDRGQELSAMIDKLVEQTVDKVKAKCSLEEQKQQELLDILEKQTNCSENVKSFIERFLMLTSDVFTINYHKTLTENVEACLKYMKPPNPVPIKSYVFKHGTETETTTCLEQMFGEVKLATEEEQKTDTTTYESVQKQKARFTIKNRWNTGYSADIDVMDNGKIVTLSGTDVEIRNMKGKLLKTFSIPTTNFPWNVAAIGNEVYVTNQSKPSAIFVIETEYNTIEKEATIGERVKGLALNPVTKEVFISCGNLIQKSSIAKMKFNHFTTKALSTPSYICVTHDNRIVVSNYGNHMVNCYDADGLLIWTYDVGSYRKFQLRSPRGVCVDSEDNIYVADSENHRIVMISKDGEFLQLVDAGETIKSPCGLAFKDGCLYVSTQNPGTIVQLQMC